MARRRRPREGGVPERGSVYPTLDLHGMTGDEARASAERWLRARQGGGERTVVLITGRGNRSPGAPVLLGEIEHLLEGLAGPLVEGFERVVGGGGFLVTLRRQSSLGRPRDPAAAGLRDVDPSLRRRAEEALSELGIAPTPALVRAEIRRLLEEEDGGEDG
ncbi:MAG TPA: Smr/MutS family protein [Longimicrobium sp.]|nr:Smr/MutS family protein [Longimicrobium sp.]